MTSGNRGIGRWEIAKDTAQVVTEAAAVHVGRMASIVSGAVRGVAHEMGELATEVFEMRAAAGRAAADNAAADNAAADGAAGEGSVDQEDD
jgi:hypothetical protein